MEKEQIITKLKECGSVAVGSLTSGAKNGDFNQITQTAKIFIERIKEAHGQ